MSLAVSRTLRFHRFGWEAAVTWVHPWPGLFSRREGVDLGGTASATLLLLVRTIDFALYVSLFLCDGFSLFGEAV
jgi:hypothetical protein